MKKKLLSLALALALCLSLTVPALAADHGFFSVSANHLTSAAIKEDGSLWMWGYNYYGAVGDGTREHAMSPVKVMEDVAYAATDCFYLTAALKSDGSVWQWGKTDYTAPAGGNRKISTVPEKVMDGAVSLFARYYTLAAIKEDGSLWMWGSNYDGKIGDGTTKDALTPVKIMDDVADVVEGDGIMCALKKDGSVWVWGSVEGNPAVFPGASSGNAKNKVGNSIQTVPVKVMDDAVAIEAMGRNFGALKGDDTLWVWGSNDGSDFLFYDPYPGPTQMLSDVKEIVSCGFAYGAIKNDQSLWMWGELPGDDSFRFTAVPEKSWTACWRFRIMSRVIIPS